MWNVINFVGQRSPNSHRINRTIYEEKIMLSCFVMHVFLCDHVMRVFETRTYSRLKSLWNWEIAVDLEIKVPLSTLSPGRRQPTALCRRLLAECKCKGGLRFRLSSKWCSQTGEVTGANIFQQIYKILICKLLLTPSMFLSDTKNSFSFDLVDKEMNIYTLYIRLYIINMCIRECVRRPMMCMYLLKSVQCGYRCFAVKYIMSDIYIYCSSLFPPPAK